MHLSKFRKFIAFARIAAFTICVVGCASWKDDRRSSETQLPPIRESERTVILEVEFVPIMVDQDDRDSDASLWQWVDETAIDVTSRRRLIANGLRVGRIVNEERFRSRLGDMTIHQDVVDKFLTEASIASEVSHNGKRIPMRLGRRYELILRQPIDGDHVTLLRLGDETIGRTLSDPQYLFAVTASSGQASGQVNVRLRPEVQYGEMRQKWVSSDAALRIDTRRETWSMDQLDVDLTGTEGNTFVVAATNPLSGLAKQMLSGSSADHLPQQLVVLIHLEQVPNAIDRL